ncbi:unnamed protein product, partial [Ectocarpus sp. 13 AM-2016]
PFTTKDRYFQRYFFCVGFAPRRRACRITTFTTTTTSFKMSSTPTLSYFDLPGRAEATRVALAYAGKEF